MLCLGVGGGLFFDVTMLPMLPQFVEANLFSIIT